MTRSKASVRIFLMVILLQLEIDPYFLDLGENSLYAPWIAFVTMKNAHKNGVLHVYERHRTDPQHFAYGFKNLRESASISFVF